MAPGPNDPHDPDKTPPPFEIAQESGSLDPFDSIPGINQPTTGSPGFEERANEALAGIPGIFDEVPGAEAARSEAQAAMEQADPLPLAASDDAPAPMGFSPLPEFAEPNRESAVLESDVPESDLEIPAYTPPPDPHGAFGAIPLKAAPGEAASAPADDAPPVGGGDDSSDAPPPHIPPLPPAFSPPINPMQEVRKYSEQIASSEVSVPAALPFHLSIEGHLTDYDKAKLIDVITRDNFGIREMDLEPQFEAGRILLPQISEFAGVLVVQALRGANARVKLIPAGIDDDALIPSSSAAATHAYTLGDALHAAEGIPLTTESALPGIPAFIAIDTIVASAALRCEMVEAQRSTEYQELLEALMRELKFKAFRRGAQAVLNFGIDLTSLSLPSHYRLTVTGLAIKSSHASAPAPSAPRWN